MPIDGSVSGNVYDVFDLGEPAATMTAVFIGGTQTAVPLGQTTVLTAPTGVCGQGSVNADGALTFQRSAVGFCGFRIELTNSAGTSRVVLGFTDV